MHSCRKPVQVRGGGGVEPMTLQGQLNAPVIFVAGWKHKADKCAHLCCSSWLIQLIFIEHLQGSWRYTVGERKVSSVLKKNSWSCYKKTMMGRWCNWICSDTVWTIYMHGLFKLGLNMSEMAFVSLTLNVLECWQQEVNSTIRFQSPPAFRWWSERDIKHSSHSLRAEEPVCLEKETLAKGTDV